MHSKNVKEKKIHKHPDVKPEKSIFLKPKKKNSQSKTTLKKKNLFKKENFLQHK